MESQKNTDELFVLHKRVELLEEQIHSMKREKSRMGFSRKSAGRAIIAIAASIVILVSGTVLSQVQTDCAEGLFCFSANSPAKASEVNSNLAILKNWLVEKVGAVGNSNITAGSVSTSGDIRNTASDGELGASANFVFRDTGDSWLRLRGASGGDTYSDLAVGDLYVGDNASVGGGITATSFNGLKMASGHYGFGSTACGASIDAPCSINISAGKFSQSPACTIASHTPDGTGYEENMVIKSISATSLDIWQGNYHTQGSTQYGYWICIGG